MDKKTKIILGVAAVAAVAYFTRDMWMPKKDETKKDGEVKSGFISAQDKLGTFTKVESKSNFVSCRAGTCPYRRADGSIFCTSAACPKSTSNTAKA